MASGSLSVQCPPLGFGGKYYHVSADGGSCVRDSSFFGGKPVLNQGVGYSVILGFGAFFAVFTSFLVYININRLSESDLMMIPPRSGLDSLESWILLRFLIIYVHQVWLEKRYVGSRHTSEWFNTAGRNVKTGLIASVIVSQVSIQLLLSI